MQFRGDIRRGLEKRFVRFIGAGEVDGLPAGGYRYKVAVLGREGQLGIVWYYYLIASPEGEQLLATFTMAEDHVQLFGDQDLEMIGSLEWHKKQRSSRGTDGPGLASSPAFARWQAQRTRKPGRAGRIRADDPDG